MARPKKGSKENPVTEKELNKVLGQAIEELLDEKKRPYKIIEAVIKDDFCSYKYEVVEGLGINDIHNVSGKGLILDDLRNIFTKFKVHLAAIDGAFRRNAVEVEDIDMHHGDDITGAYHVTGFKIRGSGDMECIILVGSKFIQDAGGRMALETPKIDLSSLSSYKWYNELKDAADKAREEVALYKEGKCIPVKNDDDDDEEDEKGKKKKAKQLTIASPEAAANNSEADQEDVAEDIASEDTVDETEGDDDLESGLV